MLVELVLAQTWENVVALVALWDEPVRICFMDIGADVE